MNTTEQKTVWLEVADTQVVFGGEQGMPGPVGSFGPPGPPGAASVEINFSFGDDNSCTL